MENTNLLITLLGRLHCTSLVTIKFQLDLELEHNFVGEHNEPTSHNRQ